MFNFLILFASFSKRIPYSLRLLQFLNVSKLIIIFQLLCLCQIERKNNNNLKRITNTIEKHMFSRDTDHVHNIFDYYTIWVEIRIVRNQTHSPLASAQDKPQMNAYKLSLLRFFIIYCAEKCQQLAFYLIGVVLTSFQTQCMIYRCLISSPLARSANWYTT